MKGTTSGTSVAQQLPKYSTSDSLLNVAVHSLEFRVLAFVYSWHRLTNFAESNGVKHISIKNGK